MVSLTDLRAEYAVQEAAWERVRHELAGAEEQLAALRARLLGGKVSEGAVRSQEDVVLELRREGQRLKIALGELAQGMADNEQSDQQNRVRQLQERNEVVKRELDLCRREILKSLLGMAELLRYHQQMAQEKVQVSADIAKLTGEDFGYENYISCAPLHNKDNRGDVQFVVDAIKKIRPVS
jgi:chromosome segregation ATPase